MASLRDIRRRIGSVKNTRQITRAMKLVAGAKLKRATDAALAAKPYQETLQRVLSRVVSATDDVEHPLLMQPDNDTDVLVVVVTSDRGLCGGFNGQLLRATQRHIDELVDSGKTVKILAYGKKGRAHFASRGYDVVESQEDLVPAEYVDYAEALGARLVADMNNEAFSQAVLAYNKYVSVMTQEPRFEAVLPMDLTAAVATETAVASKTAVATTDDAGPDDVRDLAASMGMQSSNDYLFEPGGQEILDQLLPRSLSTRLLQAFLEKEAGEQAARMQAMDNATRNAGELIDSLTLEYNRARQAAITTELTEIVSGAEAL